MITCEELRASTVQETLSLTETAEGWLYWFSKRGDKYLKDAAKLGYTEATLDLPIEIGQTSDRAILLIIQKGVKELVTGCFVGFVEDEYDEKPIHRLFISWK
jgi:hypothetical protein